VELTQTMDRTAFSITSLSEPGDDAACWQQRSPMERLEALEFLRQVMYGYDPATARLERVLTVVPLRTPSSDSSGGAFTSCR
jgi:hypothetical protein